MSSFQRIAICFYRQDYGDSYYNRGSDLFYQGIKFPKGSKYEGFEFYVESMSINSYEHCDINDSNRSFNLNKMWVYLCHDALINIQNIETREIKRVLSDEIKKEFYREDYDSLKYVPPFIIDQYGNDYESIKERFMPKYRLNDRVVFKFGDTYITGEIIIVDTFGTFEQNEEPSYDILVETENMDYKHIAQSQILMKE